MAAPQSLSKWANFKRYYVRPEVFPLVGAVGTAVGLFFFFGVHKASADPTVTWDKDVRNAGKGGGIGRDPAAVLADDVRPEMMDAAQLAADEGAWAGKLWASAVRRSTGIFTKTDNAITASNRQPNPVFPTVAEVRAAEQRNSEVSG
ncbi:hypothetical protein BU14_0103s0017 [Porphyra umbilicalis]|uniref:Uncharacterized protein n=1 Tax=Porphyra umbilicalis TaxID=2786 RepID=A0A1X6PDF5_PORUM|nr:hypothetical protein BU14_0103s0017 [Porphyra umbilicalis]|eukprot:OSX78673.1 hypothetical protein BU14_0103s0017 [Porphyra umbilicalis]